jgi:hypothetical protein
MRGRAGTVQLARSRSYVGERAPDTAARGGGRCLSVLATHGWPAAERNACDANPGRVQLYSRRDRKERVKRVTVVDRRKVIRDVWA